MTTAIRPRTLGWMLVALVCALIISGAAFMQRGPVATPIDITLTKVDLPDGSTLLVQPYELTISQWNRCADDGACSLRQHTRPDQDPDITPATGVSYVDVKEYLHWINSGDVQYRLPTLAEWNALADPVLPDAPDPLFTDPSLTWASAYLTEGIAPRALLPQGSFATSPAGISDLDGSVWEWTMDCYSGSADASGLCPAYFVAGEHIAAISFLVRDPARGGCAAGVPPAHLGLRLVRRNMS